MPNADAERPAWTFLSNHGHVLLALARNPQDRLRDVAAAIGITERAAQAIVADLEGAGYLHRRRVGRRNHYTINSDAPFRHPAERDHAIGELIAIFVDGDIDGDIDGESGRDADADADADGNGGGGGEV